MLSKRPLRSPRINRLAARTRAIYLGLLALAVVLLLIVGSFIFSAAEDDYAQRLSRQYSIEAAANFLASTNSHFVLAQQLANSATISQWIANIDDEDCRARALNEIEGYAAFAPSVHLRVSFYDSFYTYNLGSGFTADDELIRGVMGEGLASEWFLDTRDAELPFNLNIQRTRGGYDYSIYVWTNHRIYYEGRFVGVATAGSYFPTVFDAVFSGFDADTRRGYIIDSNGMVRVDSAELLEVFDDGWSTPAVMPEAVDNPILADEIRSHLHTMENGAFQFGRDTSDAIAIQGDYRYASIAPIVGTNWSVVVLSGHADILGGRYAPIIVGISAALILFVTIANLLIRKVAIDPLYKLTQTTASADTVEGAELFGLDRDDEIGDLARTIDLSRRSLQHQEMLLSAVNRAAEILLASTGEEDSAAAIAKGMEIIGQSVDADRVQLWRNETINGEPSFTLKYHWRRAEDRSPRNFQVGASFPYTSMPGLLEMFEQGEVINCPISKLPQTNADFLTEFGVKSIVTLPLPFQVTLGVIDCRRERTFSDKEMDIIRSAGMMFSNAYQRIEQTAELIAAVAKSEEAGRTKSRFLSNMSHEIRTPINAIIGMSSIAQNSESTEKKDYCLGKIENASKLLMEIVNQVLDMSKIEANKMKITLHPFNLAGMVDDVIDLLKAEIEQKSQNLSVTVDNALPQSIISDEIRLSQVLTSLLANAVKFTPKGGSISIRVSPADTPHGSAENFMQIEVADNGIGIPQEKQENVFNAFEQADTSSSRQYGGTGLGLAISKRIVDMVGGSIRMESETDTGSKFVFTWPCKSADENTEAPIAANDNAYEADCYIGHTVLVAEDVDINQEIMKALLDEMGVLADFAENGNEAVEKFIANPGKYSLILMDIQMPEMDGYDATKAIRSLKTARAATVPIIAMTANVFREDIERCLNVGMNAHLGKPIDISALYAVFNRYLG